MLSTRKEWLQLAAFVLIGVFVVAPIMLSVDNGLRSVGVYALIEMLFYGFLIVLGLVCAWVGFVRPALEHLGLMKP